MYEYIFATVLVGLAVVWLAYRLLKKGSGAGGCCGCGLRDECGSKPSDKRGDSLADGASTGDNPDGESPAP